MKKILFLALFLTAILFACNQGASESEEAKNLELQEEIMQADSLSEIIDEVKEEIDSTVTELDTLLNELN